MAISFNCACGKLLKSKEEMAGRKTKCPACGATLTIPGTPVKQAAAKHEPAIPNNPDALVVEGLVWTGEAGNEPTADGAPVGSAPSTRPSDLPRPTDGSLQYKVLSQKDHSASAKINFQTLEVVLNDHARQGWSVKSALVVNLPGHAGNHDELVLILER